MSLERMSAVLLATSVIFVTVVAGVVILAVLKPSQDTLTIVGLLTAFTTATLASLYAATKSSETSTKVDGLSIQVDGRLSQLLDMTSRVNKAEGRIAGMDAERARAAEDAAAAPLAETRKEQ